jgi:ABC-type multidrug transport system fused ATPase/permease subunit
VTKRLNKIFSLLGAEKRKLPLIITSFLLLSIMELIGIGMVVPLLLSLFSPDSSVFKNFLDHLPVSFSEFEKFERTLIFGCLLILMFGVKSYLSIKLHKKVIKFGFDQQVQIRQRLVEKFQKIPFYLLSSKNTSDYNNLILTICPTYTSLIISLLQFAGEMVTAAMILILLFQANYVVLGIVVIQLVICIRIFDVINAKDLVETGRSANKFGSDTLKFTQEIFSGFREIKIYNRERMFADYFVKAAKGFAQTQIKQSIVSLAPKYILEFGIISILVAVLAYWSLFPTTIEDMLVTAGLFGMAGARLLPMARSISNNILKLRYSHDAVDQLLFFISEKTRDSQNTKATKDIFSSTSQKYFEKITFKDVSVAYPKNNRRAIKNLNISISKGEMIALSGPSGSGKTTFISLLLGILDLVDGEIIIDKTKQLNTHTFLQSISGYVPQETFIMDGTIEQNIALTREPEEIDQKKLEYAVKASSLTTLVNSLSDGIKSSVGQYGVEISGGQRQRLALARALYFDRQLLILDEPTSALDEQTEKEIFLELEKLKHSKTIICVVHNKNLFKYFDRVIELKNGTNVRGT